MHSQSDAFQKANNQIDLRSPVLHRRGHNINQGIVNVVFSGPKTNSATKHSKSPTELVSNVRPKSPEQTNDGVRRLSEANKQLQPPNWTTYFTQF